MRAGSSVVWGRHCLLREYRQRAAGLPMRDRMVRKLATLRGHAICARRKAIVEPVFGQIKHARGFRQFLRRGLVRVQQEWALVCLSHNLLKLHAAWSTP